jgi:hypothetical protein
MMTMVFECRFGTTVGAFDFVDYIDMHCGSDYFVIVELEIVNDIVSKQGS